MARKIPVLNRMLGAPALYAIAYGEIGSSLYYALGITAVYALSLTPVIFLVAGAIFVLAAASYAEGGATLADTGGASAFARRAFNDLVGFIAGWATVLDYVIAISLAALFIPHYVTGAFGNVDMFTGRESTALAVARGRDRHGASAGAAGRPLHGGRGGLAARPGWCRWGWRRSAWPCSGTGAR